MEEPSSHPESAPTGAAGHRVRDRLWAVALVVSGCAVAWLVVRGGSPGWRVARLAAVAALTTVAVVGVRRAPARARGAVGLVVGLLVLAIGIGIGAQWVVEPPSPTAAAGVVAVLAGGLMAVLGALELFAGVRARWWVLLTPALLVVTLVVVRVVAVPVAATNVPPGAVPARSTQVGGVAVEPVDIASGGARLAGWWVPSRNGAAVVVLPGSGSTREAVRDQAAVLVGAGYGVLLLDPRGHGGSGGTAMDFGWFGEADLEAAVDHVSRRGGVDGGRVGVVGMSMGGEQAIGAAGVDRRIRAVVAEGATGRTAADNSWLSEVHGAGGIVQEQLDRVSFAIADLLTSASPPRTLEESLRRSDAPTLVVAAGEVADEREVALRLHEADPRDVEVWVVEGAGHTGALDVSPRSWRRRVVEHLDRHLAAS